MPLSENSKIHLDRAKRITAEKGESEKEFWLLLTASYLISTGCDSIVRLWSAVLSSGLTLNSILSREDFLSPMEATRDGTTFSCLKPVTYQFSSFASTLKRMNS